MKSFIQKKTDWLAVCPSDSKQFWHLSDGVCVCVCARRNFIKSSFSPLILPGNAVAFDASDKVETFASYFQSNSTWTTKGLSHLHINTDILSSAYQQ